MKPKPKVGQTLYSLNVGNASRRINQKLRPVKVSKVGRKYFYCERWRRDPYPDRYFIDTWKQEAGGYSATSVLYESKREYEDELEADAISKKILKAFEYGRSQLRISLNDLKKIEAILKTYIKN